MSNYCRKVSHYHIYLYVLIYICIDTSTILSNIYKVIIQMYAIVMHFDANVQKYAKKKKILPLKSVPYTKRRHF